VCVCVCEGAKKQEKQALHWEIEEVRWSLSEMRNARDEAYLSVCRPSVAARCRDIFVCKASEDGRRSSSTGQENRKEGLSLQESRKEEYG
jgi:hypothetical protein